MTKTYIIIASSRKRDPEVLRYIRVLETAVRMLGALVLVATITMVYLIY